MVIILALYLGGVYLIFFKLKLLPFNKITGGFVVVLGVTILTVFLVGLQTLTPASVQGMISANVIEIAPQVQGEVIEVPIPVNHTAEPSDVLFRIDPRPYQDQVDQLKAQLVEAESTVAQLKEAYDAARAQVRSTNAQLALSRTRLTEYQQLFAAGAGSKFDVENTETDVERLEQQLVATQAQENQTLLALNSRVGDRQSRVAQALAQLDAAQFNLENCEVRAPGAGIVTMNLLRPGMVVSPGRAVMTFVYTDSVMVGGVFPQKALPNIRVGDKAVMSFSALPGRLFESKVRQIPSAIGNAQFYASGQLEVITADRMTTLYMVFIDLPEDFPSEQVRLGLAADVRIYSAQAGVVGMVATILQWVQASLAYVT